MPAVLKALLTSVAVVGLGAALTAGAGDERQPAAGISYTRYSVIDLGTFGGPTSEAWGINNAGQVVGRADLAPDGVGSVYYHAFLYQNGVKTDLGTLPPGCNPSSSNSWAFDINDAGQVVGRTCANNRDPRPFLWSGGVMVDLGTLGGTLGWARGINTAGDIVGATGIAGDGASHAFRFHAGSMQDLGSIGNSGSVGNHINDSGMVVGYFQTTFPNTDQAFLYSDPTMTAVIPGAGCCSYAWGINNAGKVVGTHLGGGAAYDQGFVSSSGVTTYLGSLVGGQTVAMSINNSDAVVGYSALAYNYFHAFLYEKGMMVDLNNHIPDNPEWDLNFATSINDVGQIAGIGTIGGHTHGFLLTPVPTPPTAVDDAYATPFQVPLTVPAPGVLGNDYGFGISSVIAGLVTLPSHGILTFNPDGGFVYTPASGYTGVDTFSYKAITISGPSVNAATVSVTVGQPPTVQPPTNLYAQSVVGDLVTFRWVPPASGPRPTGYTIEGGIYPGEVLAVFSTGSAYPIFTLAVPTGSFRVRVRATAGVDRSAASNEIQIHVRVAVPPSAPASLTSVVHGSNVHLTWRNTFTGGAPTAVYLEARAGAAVWYFPLGVADTFAAGGVPPGSYTLRVWAANAGGVSPPSNQVVITVPEACSGAPGPPTATQAYAIGRTIFVVWDPPTSGPAATSYEVVVGGAFVGRFATAARTLSGTAGPGRYDLSVVAYNPCGSSVATPTQSVTLP